MKKYKQVIKIQNFGFSTNQGLYLKAIKKVIYASHIEFEGIHCHIGSQVFDLNAYIDAMNKFVGFAYEIYDQLGVMVTKINAGGGYGIAYTEKDTPLDFELITSQIMKTIQNGYDKRGWKMPMVLIEPGRYVVGNAGITLYTIGSIKNIPDVRTYVSVDGGMSDNIRTALYDADYDGIIVNKAEQPKDTKVTVCGKICESGDIVVKEVMIAKPESGDIFAQFSTGAYHYTMSSNYNQMTKPAVVFTYQGKSRLVIRRQTFDDLIYYDTNEEY